MKHHPDLGDPEASYIMQQQMESIKLEREMREADEAERLRWNPLGRWNLSKQTSSEDGRVTTVSWLLIDKWSADKKHDGNYTVGDQVFSARQRAIEEAEHWNKETIKNNKKALAALYIEEVSNAMEAAYNELHNLRNTVENLKTYIKHSNTLEGDNG